MTSPFKLTPSMMIQSGTATIPYSTSWGFAEVVYPTPYAKPPLVSVMMNTNGATSGCYVPAIYDATATGCKIGWLGHSSAKEVVWMAIGEV